MLYNLVEYVHEKTGVDVPAIKLFTGLILSQLSCLVYRFLVSKIAIYQLRQGVFLGFGLIIGYFVWGIFMLHHVLSALGFYIIFMLFNKRGSEINFLYQLGHLVLGYYYHNLSADYAINWTTSQAVLCLKMIGLGFDVREGTAMPSLLELLGYTFNAGTYLVGPIDDINRYTSFMKKELFKSPPSLKFGLVRLLSGIFYVGLSQVVTILIPTGYMFSKHFDHLALPLKLLYIGAWGHSSLYKYLGVWCIAESSCMYTGYTYIKETDSWNGLRNMATYDFHMATSLQGIIDTFNINTNKWCFKYIYKKCKFLGNKSLSQVIVLLFLALWHGLHLGYLTCFIQEFYYMFMENLVKRSYAMNQLASYIPTPLLKVCLWVYTKVFLSFALVGFELYTYQNITTIYSSVFYFCPIVALTVIIVTSAANAVIRRKPEKSE